MDKQLLLDGGTRVQNPVQTVGNRHPNQVNDRWKKTKSFRSVAFVIIAILPDLISVVILSIFIWGDGSQAASSLITSSAQVNTRFSFFLIIQWGSKIWTRLDFKWLKHGRVFKLFRFWIGSEIMSRLLEVNNKPNLVSQMTKICCGLCTSQKRLHNVPSYSYLQILSRGVETGLAVPKAPHLIKLRRR